MLYLVGQPSVSGQVGIPFHLPTQRRRHVNVSASAGGQSAL